MACAPSGARLGGLDLAGMVCYNRSEPHDAQRGSMVVIRHQVSGDVAQLGERVNGIHEVVGSIPIVSTTFFD